MPVKPCDPAAKIHAAPEVLSPQADDEFPLTQSDAGFTLGKITWANLYAVIIASLAETFEAAGTMAAHLLAFTHADIASNSSHRTTTGTPHVSADEKAQWNAAYAAIPALETWTPEVVGSVTAGAGTYTLRRGYCVKIGRLVYVQMYVNMSAHSGAGNMQINNLPYPLLNVSGLYGGGFIPVVANMAVPANSIPVLVGSPNSAIVTFASIPTGGGSITYAYLALDTAFAFSGTFMYISAT